MENIERKLKHILIFLPRAYPILQGGKRKLSIMFTCEPLGFEISKCEGILWAWS